MIKNPAQTLARAALVLAFAMGFGLGVGIRWGHGELFSAQKKHWTTTVTAPPQTTSDANKRLLMSAPKVVSSARNRSSLATEPAFEARAAGDYVLDSDVEALRVRTEARTKKALEFVMSTRGQQYAELYNKYGIDEKTSAQLVAHVSLIYKAKMDAAHAMTNLVNAQVAYDERMRDLLGNAYPGYAAFEGADLARRQTADFLSSSMADGLGRVPDGEQVAIQSLMQRMGAYSSKVSSEWGGPYDQIPKAFAGYQIIPILESELGDLKQNASSLLREGKAIGLGDATMRALEAYYGTEIANAERRVASARNPGALLLDNLEKSLARQKANPKSNPEIIRRLESQIATMRAEQPAVMPK